MWKVIYIAQGAKLAERIKDRMQNEGLLVTLRPLKAADEEGSGPVEVMVPQSEAEEAHEMLSRLLCNPIRKARG